jgi:hypothetical protein
MQDGLTPQKFKIELSIEKDNNAHVRSEDFKDLMHKISKWGIVTLIIVAVVWYLFILWHNIQINNWDYIVSNGEKLIFGVIGYFVGLINKKFIET